MEKNIELKGFFTLKNQAFIELERLELVGMFALMSNFISTYSKHDLGDGLGKVWTLIRVNQIYEKYTNHGDKTINSYIDKLIENGFLIRKKIGIRKIYFRLTDNGKKLIQNKNCKDTKQDTNVTSSPKEKKVKQDIKTIGEECPECGEELVIRTSEFSDFVGCSSYPKCRYTRKIDNKTKNRIAVKEKISTDETPFMIFNENKKDNTPPSWL